MGFCDLIKSCTYIHTLQIATDAMLRQRSLPKQHRHQLAPLVPVYVGHNLPDTITLHVLLRHFEAHNFLPDTEESTIIDKPGKRHGKLFFHDFDAADRAIAGMNGTKIASFAIVVEHWESRVKQPLSRSRGVVVKVSNCHYSFPREKLQFMVHAIAPTSEMVFHETELTKPNWAHINCEDLSSADKVVTSLHGTFIHDLPLSAKVVRNGKQDVVASIHQPILSPPPLQPVRPASGIAFFASVKVLYIPKSVTEDDILRLLSRTSEVSVKVRAVADQKFNYAYVNCTDRKVADMVVHCLNGRSVGGNRLRAKIVEQPGASSVLPVESPKQQKSFDKPREWEGDLETFSLKDVPPDSAEFKKVLLLMQNTIPSVKILKLERIQNKWLWNKYSQHCDEIKEKNGGVLMEKELFHGTSANDPQQVYNGEEGFDMRFCTKGMWGRGSYFAASAMYSHQYAYTPRGNYPGGSRQMFLARVNIGETHECPPDCTLTMPPARPLSEACSSSSMQFSVIRYDSVTGVTGISGSRVYIIYDNRKAYPLYLITYTFAC